MEEEIEILKSIFMDDIVSINLNEQKPSLEIALYPASDYENQDKKLIHLNLVIYFPSNYPNSVPEFCLKNIRGVSDEDIFKIKYEIQEIAIRNLGIPMMFEIFQYVKDVLTEYGNIPKSCVCAICLYNFDPIVKFIQLSCQHYFHLKCLIKHVHHMENEIRMEQDEAVKNKIKWKPRRVTCPICRESLTDAELELLSLEKVPIDANEDNESNSVVISEKTRELQKKMEILFNKQKINGGIIPIQKDDIIVLTRPQHQNTACVEDNDNLDANPKTS